MKVSVVIHEVEIDEARSILDQLKPTTTSISNTPLATELTTAEDRCDEVAEVSAIAEQNETTVPEKWREKEVELDRDGVPWDERIHSSNRKKTGNGVWQRRRNVDELTFTTIKNELLGIDNKADNVTEIFTTEQPTAVQTHTFNEIMQHLNSLFASGKIDHSYPQQIVEAINHNFNGAALGIITEIANDQSYINFVWDVLEQDGHVAA